MNQNSVTAARTERLRPGVYATRRDGRTTMMSWPHHLIVDEKNGGRERLQKLSAGQPGGADDAVTALLRAEGWLVQEFGDDAGTAFVVHPLRAPSERPIPDADAVDLSRFAIVRREGPALLIESPLASAEIVLHRRALLTVALSGADSLPVDGLAAALRRELRLHGLLALPGGTEDTELRLRQWAPHELLFHDRSRLGYRGYVGDGFGGTWWGKKAGLSPEAAVPAPFGGERVGLPLPDMAARRANDPPYSDVVEGRVSARDHDDADPITVEQLGELLYRTDRVRRIHVEDGVEFVNSPRPSGGSVYELEIYVAASLCAGLESGFYHYDAHRHELERVTGIDDPAVRRMVRVATQGSTTGAIPQVLLVIAARVGRVMWKYEGMGFGVVLKNTGVLYHALALTCSAMELAGCPLGTDDAVAFTEATGRDPLTECSVGQFIVGSRPPTKGAIA